MDDTSSENQPFVFSDNGKKKKKSPRKLRKTYIFIHNYPV